MLHLQYGEFPLDSGEIWESLVKNLLTFCNFDWGCDHLSVLDFGSGVGFVAFASNPERGLDDYEIDLLRFPQIILIRA